jgi:hypothetical protein
MDTYTSNKHSVINQHDYKWNECKEINILIGFNNNILINMLV